MKVFVPLADDALDALRLAGVRLVPYRCGMPLLPASDAPAPCATGEERPPPRDPSLSAAA